MPQQIQIALDPDLGLDPETFIAEWNGRSQTNTVGQLHLAPADSVAFHDPNALMLVLETAVAIATSVLTTVLTDYLKEKYYPKEPEITEIQQPDGKTIIIIRQS